MVQEAFALGIGLGAGAFLFVLVVADSEPVVVGRVAVLARLFLAVSLRRQEPRQVPARGRQRQHLGALPVVDRTRPDEVGFEGTNEMVPDTRAGRCPIGQPDIRRTTRSSLVQESLRR